MDIKKIIAKLPVGYVEEAAGMDGDALRAEIIRAETSIRETEREMGSDEKLQGVRTTADMPQDGSAVAALVVEVGGWRAVSAGLFEAPDSTCAEVIL